MNLVKEKILKTEEKTIKEKLNTLNINHVEFEKLAEEENFVFAELIYIN